MNWSSCGKGSVVGPCHDQDFCIRREPCLRSPDSRVSTLYPWSSSALLGFGIAGPFGIGGILFAVALDKIDLLGFGSSDLNDGVGEILFLNLLRTLFDLFSAVVHRKRPRSRTSAANR